jgi:hypothetical protein
MKILMLIGLTLVEIAKQIWALPKTIAQGFADRKQRKSMDVMEAERLDRIRNPLKYQGKE